MAGAAMACCVSQAGAMMAGVGAVGPLSNGAYVNVDELALGVVADATGVEGFSCVAEQWCGDALDAEIDGFGDDVLGVFGGVGGAAGAECVVSFLRAIAGEDVDRAIGLADFGEHGVEDVEGARVELAYFFIVAVAQELVELVECLGNVGIADAVDDVDHFAGMGVGELELVDLAVFREFGLVLRQQADAGQGGGDEGVGDVAEARMAGPAMADGLACDCGLAGVGAEGGDGCEGYGREDGCQSGRGTEHARRSNQSGIQKRGQISGSPAFQICADLKPEEVNGVYQSSFAWLSVNHDTWDADLYLFT